MKLIFLLTLAVSIIGETRDTKKQPPSHGLQTARQRDGAPSENLDVQLRRLSLGELKNRVAELLEIDLRAMTLFVGTKAENPTKALELATKSRQRLEAVNSEISGRLKPLIDASASAKGKAAEKILAEILNHLSERARLENSRNALAEIYTSDPNFNTFLRLRATKKHSEREKADFLDASSKLKEKREALAEADRVLSDFYSGGPKQFGLSERQYLDMLSYYSLRADVNTHIIGGTAAPGRLPTIAGWDSLVEGLQ